MKRNTLIITLLCCIVLILIMLLGKGSEENKLNKQGMPSNAEVLFKYKTSYVGDNSKVVNLTSSLYYGAFLNKITLQTKDDPYGILAEYKINNQEADIGQLEKKLINNAAVMFSLIENVDTIVFQVDIGGKLDKYSFARSEFDSSYGGSIWEQSKDMKSFEAFLHGLE